MKYGILVLSALFFLTLHTASAFTINYSSLRKIFAPQLTSVSNSLSATSSISDFFLGNDITETVLSGSSSGTVSIKDIVYDYFSTGTVETGCSVFVQDSGNSPIYTAVNPSIATINSVGSTTYILNGTAYFNAKIGRRTKTTPCTFSRTSAELSYAFNSLVSTSTVRNMKEEIDTRISGKIPSSATYDIYSSINDTTHTYVRNSGLFASDVDFTCIPTLSGALGNAQTMGVLVTPDIMIQASHSHPAGTMYFVKNDNTTVSRNIVSGAAVLGTDIYIARLDSIVPEGITPCKIFPSNTFTSSISTTSIGYSEIPVLFSNQSRSLRIGRLFFGPHSNFSYHIEAIRGTEDYYSWYSKPCCGDSGSPVFALVNDQAVVLGTWFTSYDFPSLHSQISSINSVISSLGSSHTLSTMDLSGFASF